jgi:ATP-dependent Lon protease
MELDPMETSETGSLLDVSIVPLKDTVVFPNGLQTLTVGRERSLRALDALNGEGVIALVMQRDPEQADPLVGDLHTTGATARVLRVARLPDQQHAILVVMGLARVRLVGEIQNDPHLKARVELVPDIIPDEDTDFSALIRSVRDLFAEIIAASPFLSNELIAPLQQLESPSALADFVASVLPSLDNLMRQQLLEMPDVRARLFMLNEELIKEHTNLRARRRIQAEVEARLGKSQREYFLREEMRAIQKELGDADPTESQLEDLKRKLDSAGLPAPAKLEADRELDRLTKMAAGAAEYSVSLTYLDWLASLPWNKITASENGLDMAQRILDEDHFGLEKVKERILEYLAVLKLRRELKGPILCFVGPPGVGKTSLGKSIARASGRAFARIALGGMHDEAEIRGHRRTYVGALPGQIIQGLRRAGTRDPVFMLDEIDKLGKDFRGDPAAALMEVLDPEQNAAFQDHYLDLPFDLSKVLFVTTANTLDSVPSALLDRMEVLELAGYSETEKIEIARRYLVPKQAVEHGLRLRQHIGFEDDSLRDIIRSYTHEAGVRNLEREIGKICRKRARALATGSQGLVQISSAVVRERLGVPRFHVETEVAERTRRPGVAVALAWTPHGGDLLFVEVTRMPRGRGAVTMTGQLGEVMQESAKAALSWVRANSDQLGIGRNSFREVDLHIHVPSGAIPKDGPSAGVVMVTALVSLFIERPVRPYVAMTGEITLSGQVLAVGGIKEKVLAARRSGIREIILSKHNEPNVAEDLPAELRQNMKFHFVSTTEEALVRAFLPGDLAANLGREELRPPFSPARRPGEGGGVTDKAPRHHSERSSGDGT